MTDETDIVFSIQGGKALLYRCTEKRRSQITRLAETLSAGTTFGRKASFTDTMDAALDALESKLKGAK